MDSNHFRVTHTATYVDNSLVERLKDAHIESLISVFTYFLHLSLTAAFYITHYCCIINFLQQASMGRRSLVAANRTSCPPGHGISFTDLVRLA